MKFVLDKGTFALFLILSFTLGVTISSNALAQVNNTFPNPPPVVTNPTEPEEPVIITPPQPDNTVGIIALITSIGAVVSIVVKILPSILDMTEKVTGMKVERKEEFLEVSRSIGESDFWQLENMERIRQIGKGAMTVFPILEEMLTKPEVVAAIDKANDKAAQVRQGLTMIEQAIPKETELAETRKELNDAARDPKVAG